MSGTNKAANSAAAANNATNKTDTSDTTNGHEQESASSTNNTDGSKKELPVDLFSDDIPSEEVLPLDGKVKNKDYGSLPDSASGSTTGSAPNTTPGSTPDATSISSSDAGASSTSAASGSTTSVTREKTKLTPEEQQTQAKQTVDLMLKGYEKLHQLGRWIGKIDNNELMMLHQQGKINLHQQLPIGNKTVTEHEFFSGYNAGIDENITVSEEFKISIRPPLERVCIKNEWFVSDELFIITTLTEDITTKVSLLVGLKKSCSLVLSACMDIQKNINAKNQPEKENSNSENKQEHPASGGDEENKQPDTKIADEWREVA